ncbi:predicted protein [Uncinocarpus reesii 1704]|uniref:Uncharacterized protein n=1 Tax=Uncinocarpus reesii (strain UAMH 1704) TaxID=336963 RepID=C4JLL9_UNCRE|nr:uncharacterized protein UREG_03727 [Uncinocarpus reesii 1704]EEP78881.1 predicted protein [Uncinocarpus reesii 1704]
MERWVTRRTATRRLNPPKPYPPPPPQMDVRVDGCSWTLSADDFDAKGRWSERDECEEGLRTSELL